MKGKENYGGGYMEEREPELPENPERPERLKRWTEEEIDYLKENVGYRRIKDIAETLGRTETAVTLKIKRLKLGKTRSLSDKITSGELANILQVDRNTVRGWINYHGLPASKKVTSHTRKYILISPESFWKWAESHRERIDFQKLERNALPPEPKWVDEERRNPSYCPRIYQEWTTKEDKLLAELIDKGLSYRDIAKQLRRSPYSVEKRYHRIKHDTNYYKGTKPYAIKKGERLCLRRDTLSGD